MNEKPQRKFVPFTPEELKRLTEIHPHDPATCRACKEHEERWRAYRAAQGEKAEAE